MAAWGYEFYLLVLKVSLKFVFPRGHEISSRSLKFILRSILINIIVIVILLLQHANSIFKNPPIVERQFVGNTGAFFIILNSVASSLNFERRQCQLNTTVGWDL